jgi:replicative DNA helicase
MSYYDKLTKDLADYVSNTISGIRPGITTGFNKLDEYVGRLEEGQLWAVGGYSGVGKSYFVLNMIDRIAATKPDKPIAIFTTELSAKAYSVRHALMRAGVWKRNFENNPAQFGPLVLEKMNDYVIDLIASEYLKIIPVSTYEQVVAELEEANYEIAFIDYLQELSVAGKFGAKDAMPLIAGKLKDLAKIKKLPIVAVSQITNAAAKDGTYITAPFDYGKELNRAAHASIILEREVDDFGKTKPMLSVKVTKARDGETVSFDLDVLSGYRLRDI